MLEEDGGAFDIGEWGQVGVAGMSVESSNRWSLFVEADAGCCSMVKFFLGYQPSRRIF